MGNSEHLLVSRDLRAAGELRPTHVCARALVLSYVYLGEDRERGALSCFSFLTKDELADD